MDIVINVEAYKYCKNQDNHRVYGAATASRTWT